MFISIINIVKGLVQMIEDNREHIDSIIHVYEHGKRLNIFEGMRKSIPAELFPSLELEPSDASMDWVTTEHQNASYSIEFTLTISTTKDDIGAEYISNLTREFMHLFNNPANMTFIIPFEKSYDPVHKKVINDVRVQYGSVSSVSLNATKDGSIRVARWTWTGNVRESYPRPYGTNIKLESSPNLPREYDDNV